MKYSAISDMYYGGRGSYCSVKPSKESLKRADDVIICEEKLMQLLSGNPELLEAFRSFKDAVDEQLDLIAYDNFKEGYRFGVCMGIEIAEKD